MWPCPQQGPVGLRHRHSRGWHREKGDRATVGLQEISAGMCGLGLRASTARATTECWRPGKPSGKGVWALQCLPGWRPWRAVAEVRPLLSPRACLLQPGCVTNCALKGGGSCFVHTCGLPRGLKGCAASSWCWARLHGWLWCAGAEIRGLTTAGTSWWEWLFSP